MNQQLNESSNAGQPKVAHVTAIFGGAAITFKLPRNLPTGAFTWERPDAGSFDLSRRFIGGHWRQDELTTILSWSHPESGPFGFGARESVARVLIQRGSGVYAMLAAKILEAYLFGIPEVEAHFDEAAELSDHAA